MRPVLGILAILWLLPACLPRPGLVPAPVPAEEAARLLARLGEECRAVRTLSGVAEVTMTGGAGRLAFREVVSLRRGGDLRLETWSRLSGLQALVLAREGSVRVYLPGHDRGVDLEQAPASLRRLFPPDLSAADLAALLSGRPPLPENGSSPLRRRKHEEGILLEWRREGRPIVRILLDPEGRAVGWERLGPRGRPRLSVRFHDFRETQGILLPRRIVFRSPQAGTLVLTYTTLRVNLPLPDRLFAPPEAVP